MVLHTYSNIVSVRVDVRGIGGYYNYIIRFFVFFIIVTRARNVMKIQKFNSTMMYSHRYTNEKTWLTRLQS